MSDLAWNPKKLERPRILINRQIREMHYHENEKNCKIERRVGSSDPTIRSRQALTIRGLGCQRWILRQRDRGSRCRGEERPGRAQSVVFVLEFLRFTDVRSGKAFEIWNECAQTFIPQAGRTMTRGEDAWFCAHAPRGKCVLLYARDEQPWLIIVSPPSKLRRYVGASFYCGVPLEEFDLVWFSCIRNIIRWL